MFGQFVRLGVEPMNDTGIRRVIVRTGENA
jgi:hypothetical protein